MRSISRKPGSPTISKILGIRILHKSVINVSASKNLIFRALAASFPRVVLPLPGIPMRIMRTMIGFSYKTNFSKCAFADSFVHAK